MTLEEKKIEVAQTLKNRDGVSLAELDESPNIYSLHQRWLRVLKEIKPILENLLSKESLADFNMESFRSEVVKKRVPRGFERRKSDAQVRLALALWRQAFYKQFVNDATLVTIGVFNPDLIKQDTSKGRLALNHLIKKLDEFINKLLATGVIEDRSEVLKLVDLSEVVAVDPIAFANLVGLEVKSPKTPADRLQTMTRAALLGSYGRLRSDPPPLDDRRPEGFSRLHPVAKAIVATLAPHVPGGKRFDLYQVKDVIIDLLAGKPTEKDEAQLAYLTKNELKQLGFVALACLFILKAFHREGSFNFYYQGYRKLSKDKIKRWLLAFFDPEKDELDPKVHNGYEDDMVSFLRFLYEHDPGLLEEIIAELVEVLDESLNWVDFHEVGAVQLANQDLTKKILAYLSKLVDSRAFIL